MQSEVLAAQAAGAATVPVPKQGPFEAVNVGHESIVPVKDAQGYGETHPDAPPQTQFAAPAVGGYQAAHSASLFAVVFNAHVLFMQASVAAAVEVFVHGTPFPENPLHVV